MRQLPARPNLEHLKDQAKDLLSDWKAQKPDALARIEPFRFAQGKDPALNRAQLVVAREYGFASWSRLKEHVESIPGTRDEAAKKLIDLALTDWPEPARRKRIEQILGLHPSLDSHDLALACAMGNLDFVQSNLSEDQANEKIGPANREPLLYSCFSWFLGNDESRRPGIRDVVRHLLSLGADPNASFPHGEWPLSALYGAAGLNRDLETTRMLLDAGANPNDGESCYHCAEKSGHEFYELLFAKGVDEGSKSHAIFRKLDFDDFETVRWLLDHGVSPNARWSADQSTPLMQCLNRNRSIDFVRLLLEKGADPNLHDDAGQTPYRLALTLGRRDVADLLLEHCAQPEVGEFEQWASEALSGGKPSSTPDFEKLGRSQRDLACQFACTGQTKKLERLLDAGFPIKLGLWSTPLHAACWNGRLETVRMLLARGAPLDIDDPVYKSSPTGWTMHGSVYCKGAPPEDYVAIYEALIEAGSPMPKADEAWWQEEGSASPEIQEWLLERV